MPATVRLTQSRACASCGAYRGASHYSFCQPEVEHQFPIGDAWFSAAADDLASMDDEDQWMRLWYAPRIGGGKHVW
jgi:hypothetical protein